MTTNEQNLEITFDTCPKCAYRLVKYSSFAECARCDYKQNPITHRNYVSRKLGFKSHKHYLEFLASLIDKRDEQND